MSVKVTGYSLRTAIKKWTLKRDSAATQFPKTLYKFKNESKPAPLDVAALMEKAEIAIAKLQAAQVNYNAQVQVELRGSRMSLAEAVKRMGGASRLEKLWKSAAGLETGGRNRDYYGAPAMTRSTDTETAEGTLTADEAASKASEAADYVSALQEAIASGNGQTIEIEIDQSLFG